MPKHTSYRARTMLFGLIAFAMSFGQAQDMAVGADLQAGLFLRVLSFDRTLNEPNAGGIVIGILFQPELRASVLAKDEIRAAFVAQSGTTIHGRKVSHVTVPYTDAESLRSSLRTLGIHILYVCPFRAVDISAIAAAATSGGVRTITGVPEYVSAGLAVGIGSRADHPSIVVNLRQARAQGMDLSAQLLKLVQIVE